MIQKIKAEQRHFSDLGWLKTYWLFSFDNYYDAANTQFGNLRVFNDDSIAANSGFPTHPHSEMEIITIVLDGELSHEDSSGGKGSIKAGEVQRMSAGTGIMHSEFNSSGKTVHLHQIWLTPNKQGVKPSYSQKDFSKLLKKNSLTLIASGKKAKNSLKIQANASISRGILAKGKSLKLKIMPSSQVFIYIIEGSLEVNGQSFNKNCQARTSGEKLLTLKAKSACDFILIESWN